MWASSPTLRGIQSQITETTSPSPDLSLGISPFPFCQHPALWWALEAERRGTSLEWGLRVEQSKAHGRVERGSHCLRCGGSWRRSPSELSVAVVGVCLECSNLGTWKREDLKFKVILGKVSSLRTTWDPGDIQEVLKGQVGAGL